MTHTIYLSDERYIRLVQQARDAGYTVGRGAKSQIGDFIESLLKYSAIEAYNAICNGLSDIGLQVSRDVKDGACWHYQWKRGKRVGGFSTAENAIIAAVQEGARR